MEENRKFESRTNSLYYYQTIEVKSYLLFKHNITFSKISKLLNSV